MLTLVLWVLAVLILSGKPCRKCGSMLTETTTEKKMCWGDDVPQSKIRGLLMVRTRTKKCSCCGWSYGTIYGRPATDREQIKRMTDALDKLEASLKKS